MDKSTSGCREDFLETKFTIADFKSMEEEAETEAKQSEIENDLKNGRLNLQLKEKMGKVTQFQDQVQTLEESKDFERLQSAIDRNCQLETELQHLRNADEKLKLAQIKNEELEHEVNFYKTENKSLENKFKQVKNREIQISKENKLSKEEKLSKGKKHILKEKNKALKEKNKALKEKNKSLKEKNKGLKEKNKLLKEKNKTLKKKKKALKKKNEALKEKNEAPKEKSEIFIKENEMKLKFQTEIESLQTKNNSLKEHLEGMQLQSTIMQKQIEDFKKSLPAWIETLEQLSEFLFNDGRSNLEVLLSDMRAIKNDMGISLIFFDKPEIKLSHYHDVIRELVETELRCSICSDTLKEAVTLKCSHTFCEECLETRKNTKMECPMCIASFVDQYKTPLIDNVIVKMMAYFPKENQTYPAQNLDIKKVTSQSSNDLTQATDFIHHIQPGFLKILNKSLSCGICSEVMVQCVILNCTHMFCEACLRDWSTLNQKCPVCQALILIQKHMTLIDSLIQALEEFTETFNQFTDKFPVFDEKVKAAIE